MLIKQKSLIVALVSSVVISLVLVLTLIGYLMYIELKGEEFRRYYQEVLAKVNAKAYGPHIEISKLAAKIEDSDTLRGRPVVEGVIRNNGTRNITNIEIRVGFLDKNGVVVYEMSFHPQEPPLGGPNLTQVTLPYFAGPVKVILKPNESLPFKKIITACPTEIMVALKEGALSKKRFGTWSGKLSVEVLSVEF